MTTAQAILEYYKALGVLCVAAVLYAVLHYRVAVIAQPVRLSMIETGARLLRSDISEADRGLVTFWLSKAYNGWLMVFAAFAMPFAAVFIAFRQTPAFNYTDPQIVRDLNDLSDKSFFSAFSANPVFGLIVVVEMAVVWAIVCLYKGALAPKHLAFIALQRKELAWLGSAARGSRGLAA